MADEAAVPKTVTEDLTKPPSRGKSVVATHSALHTFQIGDLVIDHKGVELTAEQTKMVHEAAEASGVHLVVKKEVE